MKPKTKNIIYIISIILITALAMYLIPKIPDFSRPLGENSLPLTLKWITIFLIADAILIGIPAWIHKVYVNDYTKIKSVWFFVIFGTIAGVLLGEQGNPVMLIPYAILMLIYASFYKKFPWWKVALTTYLGGIIVENLINRSPMQSPTLIWVALFTYPYFFTKIWENRKNISIFSIIKNLKYTIISSIVLTTLIVYLTRNNISPPLIFLAIALPFIIKIIISFFKKKKKNER